MTTMRELYDIAFYSAVAMWGCVIAWTLGIVVWFAGRVVGVI